MSRLCQSNAPCMFWKKWASNGRPALALGLETSLTNPSFLVSFQDPGLANPQSLQAQGDMHQNTCFIKFRKCILQKDEQ